MMSRVFVVWRLLTIKIIYKSNIYSYSFQIRDILAKHLTVSQLQYFISKSNVSQDTAELHVFCSNRFEEMTQCRNLHVFIREADKVCCDCTIPFYPLKHTFSLSFACLHRTISSATLMSVRHWMNSTCSSRSKVCVNTTRMIACRSYYSFD